MDHCVYLVSLVVVFSDVVNVSSDNFANSFATAEPDEAMNDCVNSIPEPEFSLAIQLFEPLRCVPAVNTLQLRLIAGDFLSPVPPV